MALTTHRHRSPSETRAIRNRFEGYNPYAAEAAKLDKDSDVNAMLAVAFEISQLRYTVTQFLPDRKMPIHG